MPYLYVYEPEERTFRLHALERASPLPHMPHMRATAADFLGASRTDVAWTHRDALTALDTLFTRCETPFSLDYAFCRLGVCTRPPATAHLAGLAFDIGRALTPERRMRLYRAAVESGLFSFVAPPCLGNGSVHVSFGAPPPVLRSGDRDVYVFVLQSALVATGLASPAVSGVFCAETARGVRRLQQRVSLPATGRMNALCWHSLLHLPARRTTADAFR